MAQHLHLHPSVGCGGDAVKGQHQHLDQHLGGQNHAGVEQAQDSALIVGVWTGLTIVPFLWMERMAHLLPGGISMCMFSIQVSALRTKTLRAEQFQLLMLLEVALR
jgi:hypothetical protein